MASSSSKERFVRSISESTATCRLYDNVVNEVFSKGLKECWKEELFFDVGLVTMEGEVIKCHKIVLASVSPFFKAAFSPLHQSHETETKTEIQLPNIPHDIMKMVIEFIYTGSIEFPVRDLQDLIMAANFLQLHSFEKKCAELIYENIDESNVSEINRFARHVGILSLIEFVKLFIEQNFGGILNSMFIFDFATDELEEILQDFNIVIKDNHGVIPPITIQEKIITEAVIKFVLHKYDSKDCQSVAFSQLKKHVRFASIMESERETIDTFLSNLENKHLAVMCNEALEQAPNTEDAVLRQRSKARAQPYKTMQLAHGYVSDITGQFNDEKPGIYVKGMKIWIRRWDGRPVYGAIEVLYSDGSKRFHGQKSDHEVYNFLLEPDEFVVKVIANSGYMIDKLEFVTNAGKTYGPFGGDGGGVHELEHPDGKGYLSHVSGCEALTQGSHGVVSLAFHFMLMAESIYLTDRPQSSSSDDYPLYYD